MKKKFSFLLVLLLALATFLAACGGNNGNNAATNNGGNNANSGNNGGEEEAPAEERAQVLNLLESSEIPSMDASLATDAVSFNVMNQVYEGLYRLGENDAAVLGMAAEEPTISEDGKTYTFKIRDAKWSNGEAVTANDFEYAWKKALNPDTAAEYAYIMYDLKNAEAVNAGDLPLDELGVKATDEKTLEVQLESAVPYFKELLSFATFYPQNEAYVTEQGDQYGLEANTSIYNGPFVMSDWKHEQSFQVQKNPDYWEADAVQLEEINWNIVKDTATGVNLYETEKADVAGLSAEFVDQYANDENFKTRSLTSVYFLRFNQENETLANVNARKAIDMAWDKQGMVDVLLNNGSIPAYYLVPQEFVYGPDGTDFREANGNFNETNVEAAKEAWAKAKEEVGFEEVSLELLNYDSENSRKIGEFLKEQLETNLEGLTVTISQQPFAQKLDLETAGDYDFSFAGWGPDYPDPMTFVDMFVTDGAHNQMGYSNSEYDQLIEDAKTTLLGDPEARWEAMLKAEQILFEDAAISPMYQSGSAYLERPYVQGILRHAFGADNSYKWAHIE
ncbi:peptide ABC transporter substrate-binding protein [Rossellomorea vietnamensis]|uniref:Peptide ABC transporter substrate-binding protein n=1 Tax=Rossellomorea vietnamensis TaxID=218284 RepID=A0A5D4NPL5_9BACI|nr:peptide ABC transporter substrate-binding protein [Rossellomorea vietnamensis]TYS15829.1 peptide ABC transporter substrate-binding protein [Rossellomorea vietnamensis]